MVLLVKITLTKSDLATVGHKASFLYKQFFLFPIVIAKFKLW